MRFRCAAAAILCGLFLGTGAISAHHALQAQFDTNKVLSLKGELARVEWINPHAYFWFDVKDETGKVTQWGAETVGPAALRQAVRASSRRRFTSRTAARCRSGSATRRETGSATAAEERRP
jgi:hypothetical protein